MNRSLRQVISFKYLGSVITDEGSKPEILSRIAETTAALTRLKPVWNDRCISLSSKIRCAPLSHPSSCMLVNHGPSQQSSKEAMEMRCNRKILRISYKDHVTNEEVGAKIQQAIGPHEDLSLIHI